VVVAGTQAGNRFSKDSVLSSAQSILLARSWRRDAMLSDTNTMVERGDAITAECVTDASSSTERADDVTPVQS
jgi:hypothetical protein